MEGVKEKLGRVIRSKWLVIVAGIWIQCTSGSSYTFGLYSQTIKSKLDYDQSTLDTISSCKDIGANLGIISGLLYGVSSPWVVLFAGAVQNCVGYAMMWLSVTGKIPRPALWQMCAYMFFAAHAQTFFNTAVVVTSVQNFPTYRGTVVGLMKGFLGLSGAILVQIYHTINEGDQSSYIFMLSWLPTVVSMLFMFVLRVCPCHQEDEKKTLDWFSAIAMIVAAYLMVAIIVENVLSMDTLSYLIICLVLLIILLFPILVAVKSELNYSSSMPLYTQPLISQESHIKEIPTHAEIREQRIPERIAGITEADFHRKQSNAFAPGSLIYSKIPKKEDAKSCSNTSNDMSLVKTGKLERGQNFTLFQAMGTLDFWLLFVSMACGMGSGLTTVNNMSQIGSSLGYTLTEIATLVSLWSIWNFLGRFGAGYISETFLHSKGCARPMFIAIALFIMSVGHLVIASGLPGALYAGSVLVGICYGCQWSLMPTTSSEIFGLQHFGTLFNVIATASPIGSYVLSVRVVGYLYDSEAQREKHLKIVHMTGLFQSPEETCNGSHCFRLSFFILSAVSLLGCFTAMALFIRTRKFYKQVIFEGIRFQSCPTVN
uniref:Uncharacterized protein n=1 Tax=Araucaria cunninghamii TaxID=56994 RepID=A0A0D6R6U4_ARACU